MAESPRPEDGIYLAQVLEQLAKLGEGMKETALLVHAEGMSHAEAGAVLGVSESTISWRVHTIRKHMGKPRSPCERWPMNEKSIEAKLARVTAPRARSRRPACAPSARRSRNSRACMRPARRRKLRRRRPKVCGTRCVSSVTTRLTGELPWPGLLDGICLRVSRASAWWGWASRWCGRCFSRYGDARLFDGRAPQRAVDRPPAGSAARRRRMSRRAELCEPRGREARAPQKPRAGRGEPVQLRERTGSTNRARPVVMRECAPAAGRAGSRSAKPTSDGSSGSIGAVRATEGRAVAATGRRDRRAERRNRRSEVDTRGNRGGGAVQAEHGKPAHKAWRRTRQSGRLAAHAHPPLARRVRSLSSASDDREPEGRDKFQHFEVNPVKRVAEEPVSTFSVDVDTASYSFVRGAAERRRAAAEGRGARRGDDQLLRLRMAGAGLARRRRSSPRW